MFSFSPALRLSDCPEVHSAIKAIEKLFAQQIRFAMEGVSPQPLYLHQFEDLERTRTGLTPSRPNTQQSKIFRGTPPPYSTLAHGLAQQPLPSHPHYVLNPRILKHTHITEKMRARLRVFLMSECAKQWLFRETCVLACTLGDLFLRRGGQVEVEQFQNMMLACLLIAAKIREGALPAISEKTFRRAELLEWEGRIVITLGFRLTPPTYYSHAQRTVFLWDHFTQEKQLYNYKFSQQLEGVNGKLRRVYELLDCVFMALDSFEWDTEVLVVNLFYLLARMVNVYEIDEPFTLTNKEFIRFFYPDNDNFGNFFERFLLQYFQSADLIDAHVGCYLKPFLRVPAVKKEWPLQETKQHYQKIREWDEVQTLPVNCYATVKTILAHVKHQHQA